MFDPSLPIQMRCMKHSYYDHQYLQLTVEQSTETKWVDVTFVAQTGDRVLVWEHTREREAVMSERRAKDIRNTP